MKQVIVTQIDDPKVDLASVAHAIWAFLEREGIEADCDVEEVEQ